MRLEHRVARLHLIAHQVRREAIRIGADAPRRLRKPFQPRRVEFQRQRAEQILVGAEVGLVDRARNANQVAKMRGGALAISGESLGGFFLFPSAVAGNPSRRSEMMKGYDRRDLVLVAAGEHAAVMVESGARELARLGLDAGPFNGKAVGVEAEPRQHRNVVGVAMVLVASVAGRLDERRAGDMLEHPEIAVDVAAFDLMGGSGRSPEEIGGKSEALGCHR